MNKLAVIKKSSNDPTSDESDVDSYIEHLQMKYLNDKVSNKIYVMKQMWLKLVYNTCIYIHI